MVSGRITVSNISWAFVGIDVCGVGRTRTNEEQLLIHQPSFFFFRLCRPPRETERLVSILSDFDERGVILQVQGEMVEGREK